MKMIGKNGLLKCIACALIAAFAIGEAGAVSMAPINPAFLRWKKANSLKNTKGYSSAPVKTIQLMSNGLETPQLGHVPSRMDLGYLKNLNFQGVQQAVGAPLPSKYDLRAEGKITAVKDQGIFGTCWAHATLGSIESAILMSGGRAYDFSEKHLANTHGFDLPFTYGGNGNMAMAYLMRWSGPIDEKEDPYPTSRTYPSSPVGTPLWHLQNVKMIPGMASASDTAEIKRNIMEHGALYVSYYHVWAALSNDEKSFYWNGDYSLIGENDGGHAVLIVGWDDDYSKSKFKHTPPGNGAFIAKNSWGSSFGENGYYYVSYYDAAFGREEVFAFYGIEPTDNYEHIYEYDPLGMVASLGYRTITAWGANIFKSVSTAPISSVGFYANVPGTLYEIYIYTGCTMADPRSGTLATTQKGTTDFAGFVTIPLNNPVAVSSGRNFSVVLKLTTNGYNYPLAFEYAEVGYSSDAMAEAGQSFISSSGTSWTDFVDTSYPFANFCCKAYSKKAVAPAKTLSAVAITGENSLQSGKTAQFTCKAKYSDGSEKDVTKDSNTRWSIASGSSYASVDSTGLVTAKSVTQQQTVKVHAEYTEGGVTKSDDWSFYVTVAPPEPPTNVAASQGTDASCVRVTWTAPAGASSYSVYRGTTTSSGNATFVQTVTVPKFNDTEAEPGVKYTYFIKAKNASGTSGFSAGAQGWRALSAPEGVTASDGTSLEYVEITWTAAPGAKYYHVYRSDDIDGEKTPLGSWQAATSYRDATATPGKVYCYTVKSAIDSRGNMASADSIFDDGYVGVPVTLDFLTIDGAATIVSGGNATYTCTATYTDKTPKPISPSWTIRTGSAYATVDSSGKVTAKTVTANQPVTLQASYSEGGVSRSTTKQITITATIPPAPSSVTLKSATTEAVTIGWSSVAGAAGYSVWRGSTTADAKKIADVGTATEYADKNGTPGVSCKYWVKASNAAGESGFSAMSVTATRGLAAPTGVVASDGTYTDKTLVTWKPVTGATHYRVARAGSATGSKTELGSWQTGTSYEDKSGSVGTHYWYFVKAATSSSGANASAYSAYDEGWRPVVVTLSSIEISGAARLAAGGSTVLSCTAKYSSGSPKTVKPEWSVSPTTAATIDADGKLTAKRVTENVTVTVTARFTDGTTKTATHQVVIVAPIVATAEVKNVQAKTRWPFSNFLDVDYELVTQPAGTRALVTLSGRDDDKGVAMAARSLTGDGATGPVEAGKHRLTWDVAADYPDFHTTAFSVEMSAVAMSANMPSNVTASAGTSTAGVNIGWAAVDDATSYEVWRNTSNVTNGAERIQTTDQVAYTDTGAAAGTTYYYWVRSITPDGTSDFGKPVSGWRAYADITVTFNPNGGSVSPTSKSYSPTKTYGSLPTASRTGYDFDGWYTASSGGTKVTTATTVPTTAHTLWAQWTEKPIYTPSNVSASDGTSTAGVTISWSSATGANSYKIYRYTSNNSSSASSIGETSSTSYSDTTATAGTVYYYWVKSLNTDNGQSSSLSSSDTGYRKLSAPTNVAASDGKYADKVTVSWSAVSGANTYYVYRNTSNNSSSASLLGTTSSTDYTDSSIALGTTYYYWVKAYANSSSSYSDLSSADAGYPLKALVSIEIIGPDSLDAGSNVTYTCIATYSDGAKAEVTPTWSLSSGSSYGSINSSGVFTAIGTATQRSVTIAASYTENGVTVSNTKGVTITTFTVTITFNGNGGTPSSQTQTCTAYGTYGSLPTVTRTGYTFAGWYTAESGGTQVTTSSIVPSANTTLWAHWTAIAPGAPTNVSATDGTYSDKVTISWSAVSGATKYYIYRNTSNDCSSATELGNTTSTSYSDTTAVVGTTYYYWVKAYRSDNGQYSAVGYSDAGYATIVNPTKLYLVVDLSAGPDASGYPMSELNDVPSGGWTDEYKTNKLVLRRIANGSFTMGSPSGEVGHDSDEDQHQVTISKPFYMGVFQVTQRQYELVMGSKPSYFSNASYYATRPVEQVSYNMIRGSSDGAKWPSANSVDSTSFMGKIRAKTGLTFDLPTDAQWEYACRAGTTTALNSGKNLTSTSSDSNMNEVGRYYYNFPCGSTSYSSSSDLTAGTAVVGSYKANNWGLYDMHGNVWEWCLDWYQSSLGTSAVTDPKGFASGWSRVLRGGGWSGYAQSCRSADRDLYGPSNGSYTIGFRLCCPAGL